MVPTLTEEFYLEKRINVDISAHCMLKCPRCARQKPGYEKGTDITVENFSKICKTFKNIAMMGSASDCIYHHDFISILDVCVKHNNNVNIHTNGHGKSVEWWDKVIDKCKDLNNVTFVFALDGLPEESELYRVGQDGPFVWEIMKKVKNKGLKVSWQYIVFKYNQDHIEEAKQLSLSNDIDFVLVQSSRWKYPYDPFKPDTMYLEQRGAGSKESYDIVASCKLPTGYNPAYLLIGYFLPCCAIRHEPILFQEKFHIDNVDDIVKEIFQSQEWIDFYQNMETKPCPSCVASCTSSWIKEIRTTYSPNGDISVSERL